MKFRINSDDKLRNRYIFMNIVKKISGLLAVTLFCSASWGMQEGKEQLVLPKEIGATMASRILGMAEWEREEYEYAISDEGFIRLQQLLLVERKQHIIQEIEPLIVNSADFFAAFMLYSVIDILIAKNTIDNITLIVADNLAKEIIWKPSATCEWTTVNDTVKKIVKNMSWESYREMARSVAMSSPWEDSWHAACDATGSTVTKILDKLNLKDPTANMDAAWKLINLHAIAAGAQVSHAERVEVFLKIKNEVYRKGFSMPMDKMLAILDAALWNNPKLVENPHAMVLKDIFEWFAQKVSLGTKGAAVATLSSFPPHLLSYFADTESPTP